MLPQNIKMEKAIMIFNSLVSFQFHSLLTFLLQKYIFKIFWVLQWLTIICLVRVIYNRYCNNSLVSHSLRTLTDRLSEYYFVILVLTAYEDVVFLLWYKIKITSFQSPFNSPLHQSGPKAYTKYLNNPKSIFTLYTKLNRIYTSQESLSHCSV